MKTKHRPFFTIGIPTYNRERLLDLAIKSVLKQDFQDFEIVVVDNQSTDNTYSLMKSYCSHNKNIIYIRNKINNQGLISIKQLFDEAHGEYLFMLCDDDLILKENTLSGLHEIIKKTNTGFIKLEALLYHDKIENIVKTFKFKKMYSSIKPHDRFFIEKTIGKYFEFWSGSIYKLDQRLIDLIDTKEWLYTTLDYIFAITKMHGAVFTGDFCILAHYKKTNDITALVKPSFSFDNYISIVRKYAAKKYFNKIDDILRKNCLLSIPNIKLYTNNDIVLLYILKVLKKDHNPFNKMFYYLFSITVLITPKIFFELFKKNVYHPLLKKEAYTYIKERNLSDILKKWSFYDKK